jgi:tRNA 2-thiocytidine biosynthesis protein TtcA
MLREWDKKTPGCLETIFANIQNIVPSHLADYQLFDFKRLGAAEGAEESNQSVSWLVAERD